jgi:hypothetical protein
MLDLGKLNFGGIQKGPAGRTFYFISKIGNLKKFARPPS